MRKLTIAALLSSLGPLLAYQPAYAQGSGAVTITPPAYGESMARCYGESDTSAPPAPVPASSRIMDRHLLRAAQPLPSSRPSLEPFQPQPPKPTLLESLYADMAIIWQLQFGTPK